MAQRSRALLGALVLGTMLANAAAAKSVTTSLETNTTAKGLATACELHKGTTPEEDTLVCGNRTFYGKQQGRTTEAGDSKVGSQTWWTYLGMSVFCVCCGAMAAGLTMGMMSLNVTDLEISLGIDLDEVPAGDKDEVLMEQKCARILMPVVGDHYFHAQFGGCMPRCLDPTNHHYLLVTLLLVNSAANEALPVFLDNVVPAWAAVLVSVGFVLVFGEIIPSAVFTGPNQMAIAARLSPMVKVLKFVLAPIVWPISLVLDKLLGHEVDEGLKRYEMKSLMKMTRINKKKHQKLDKGPDFDEDEWDMMSGALDLSNKFVGDAAHGSDWKDVKSIPHDKILDQNGLGDLMHLNHSRLLVHRNIPGDPKFTKHVAGVVLVKKLIGIDPGASKPVSDLVLRKPLVFDRHTSLLSALQTFQKGHSHLALITDDKPALEKAWADANHDVTKVDIPVHAQPFQIITLEDIIEEMLNDEVFDESDRLETLITLNQTVGCLQDRFRVLDRLKMLATKAKQRVATAKGRQSGSRVSTVSNYSVDTEANWTSAPPRKASQLKEPFIATTGGASDTP